MTITTTDGKEFTKQIDYPKGDPRNPLTDAEVETVGGYAATAFEAMECEGLARIDFFLETPGRGFLINEVNTMPGFTPISGFPKMWEASGMSYPELCTELVELALRA